jgi:DNA invertase Pin-like site-specific DNA recombinase
MGDVVGYARVSSQGQSLEIQIDKLTKYGCNKIYQEKISGVDQNRAELIKCLDYIREDDTLVITKLDRMARSAYHLGSIVEKLKEKKVNFIVLDQNINTASPQGKLMFQMLSSFAEFENNLRKERQLEGIKKAKKEGKPFGRPLNVDEELINNVKASVERGITVSRILNYYKISQTTYYRIKAGWYDKKVTKESEVLDVIGLEKLEANDSAK